MPTWAMSMARSVAVYDDYDVRGTRREWAVTIPTALSAILPDDHWKLAPGR
jgi:hypothetical protein